MNNDEEDFVIDPERIDNKKHHLPMYYDIIKEKLGQKNPKDVDDCVLLTTMRNSRHLIADITRGYYIVRNDEYIDELEADFFKKVKNKDINKVKDGCK